MERRKDFAVALDLVHAAARAEALAFSAMLALEAHHPLQPAVRETWHLARGELMSAMEVLNTKHLQLLAEPSRGA